jgi:outer membrane lipoprotein-sorting protein
MHTKFKKPVTLLRVFVVALGVLLIAGLALPTNDAPLIGHPRGLVFAAVDPDCQAVEDASKKQQSVPYHMSSTSSFGSGPAKTTQGVVVDGILYTLVNGQWVSMALPPARPRVNDADGAKTGLKQLCQHVRDEPVNGEDAAVYSIHSETPPGNVDQSMWISLSKGLPLRMDMDFTSKNGDKSHSSIRYDYNNVQKPKS